MPSRFRIAVSKANANNFRVRIALALALLSCSPKLAAATVTETFCAASLSRTVIVQYEQTSPCRIEGESRLVIADFTMDGLLGASSTAFAAVILPPYDPEVGAYTPTAAAYSKIERSFKAFFPGQQGAGVLHMRFRQYVGYAGGGTGRGAIRGRLQIGTSQYDLEGFSTFHSQELEVPINLGEQLYLYLFLDTIASTSGSQPRQLSTVEFEMQELTFTNANGEIVAFEVVPEPGMMGLVGVVLVGLGAFRRQRILDSGAKIRLKQLSCLISRGRE